MSKLYTEETPYVPLADPGSAGARVMRGLAWFDEHGATYGLDLSRVDCASLDMRATGTCVLAQASGVNYWAALDLPFDQREAFDHDEQYGWARDHGFVTCSIDDEDNVSWGDLDAAWIAALDARRGHAGREWEESTTGSPWAW